jgi:hypothetical protein
MSGYKFRCSVYGTCPPSVISNSALLTVTTPPTPVTTSVGSVSSSCTGNVSVPVTVLNCSNVGAISLVLLFDTNKMSFGGYNSVHPQLSSGFFYVNQSGNKVTLSFATFTPVNIASGTLLNYRFIANAGISSTLSWDTQTPGNCEYSDVNGSVLTTVFNNGTIGIQSNALVVKVGNDVTIPCGQSVQLNGQVSGGVSPAFSWSPATGLSNPAVLNPFATPAETTTYRLSATGSIGCAAWDEVTVSVNTEIPQNLTINTTTISSGTSLCFNAYQVVTVAGSGNQFVVQAGGHADFVAGQKIFLKPGTTVASGGYLHGWITQTDYCCSILTSPLQPLAGEVSDPGPETNFPEKEPVCRIFPNPTSGNFILKLSGGDGSSVTSVKICDMLGEEILDKQIIGTKTGEFSLAGVASGIYLVRVMSNGSAETLKLIKH